MLQWLAFCSEIMLALDGGLRFSSRETSHMEVCWVMLSLGVSRCAGDIGKTHVNATHICVWGIHKRNVFEAVASGGAGDFLFTMNLYHTESEVLM